MLAIPAQLKTVMLLCFVILLANWPYFRAVTPASIIMIMGYGLIAVPTSIVTVEMAQAFEKNVSTQACPECSAEGHSFDAKFCKYCAAKL